MKFNTFHAGWCCALALWAICEGTWVGVILAAIFVICVLGQAREDGKKA